MYKLDRTSFKHQTAKEAAYNYDYWKNQSYEERLRAACTVKESISNE